MSLCPLPSPSLSLSTTLPLFLSLYPIHSYYYNSYLCHSQQREREREREGGRVRQTDRQTCRQRERERERGRGRVGRFDQRQTKWAAAKTCKEVDIKYYQKLEREREREMYTHFPTKSSYKFFKITTSSGITENWLFIFLTISNV